MQNYRFCEQKLLTKNYKWNISISFYLKGQQLLKNDGKHFVFYFWRSVIPSWINNTKKKTSEILKFVHGRKSNLDMTNQLVDQLKKNLQIFW